MPALKQGTDNGRTKNIDKRMASTTINSWFNTISLPHNLRIRVGYGCVHYEEQTHVLVGCSRIEFPKYLGVSDHKSVDGCFIIVFLSSFSFAFHPPVFGQVLSILWSIAGMVISILVGANPNQQTHALFIVSANNRGRKRQSWSKPPSFAMYRITVYYSNVVWGYVIKFFG